MPTELNSSSSSEEQQVGLNQINKIPEYYSTERAFFNFETNSFERTHPYVYDGSNWQISLPNMNSESELMSSLLAARKFVVRIGILYEHKSSARIFYGTGFLLTDRFVLTCAHNFDVIEWGKEKVPYSKINICCCDPANESLFSLSNPSPLLIEAKVVRRGLYDDKISDYDYIQSSTTDLALLELSKPATHIEKNECFNPKLTPSSFLSNSYAINSKLYLIGYNGELRDIEDLMPYKYLNDFNNLSVDKLNLYHNVNHKSVSVGRLIDSFITDQYGAHNCTTLPGSSGSLMIDPTGKLIGIHIGVTNSRRGKTDEMFFTKETFNRFIPIYSKEFRAFIDETILPTIHNDTLSKNWKYVPTQDMDD
ncbi:unnamed protein product [Rotaria sp. Silwood2]|nr:unnamed protein product [Rotaria sp. Silwood2]CAF2986279.1 unnamed protein product [Rotaria sp. Silwood2]CAF3387406.1 unnamed protein product [Rotaria sp. Silwood2]CAF3392193.1 unnamed protein product [Rotaria sp. Silwood2]CAF4088074.1 unnamed protein product [Rotaria sp. Silwood2]